MWLEDRLTPPRCSCGWNSRIRPPEHIANVGINKPHATNNRIERLNGMVRKRVKVQRGWKSMGTAIPEGNRVFYNFVRPHMALDGQTPAEAAGIDLNLEGNRWMQLIRAAKRNENLTEPH